MNLQAQILQDADRCVLCGLCLPHCPTYALSHQESESPRGRILLIQALAAGKLEFSPSLAGHLDSCLACRACERNCPSGVAYGRLIVNTRSWLAEQGKRRTSKVVQLLRPERQQVLANGIRLYQKSGLQRLIRRLNLLPAKLRRLEALLPPQGPERELAGYYPSVGSHREDVILFPGCTGKLLDGPALKAAVRVLTALGYGVHLPPISCCGALALHQGEREQSLAQMRQTRELLAAYPASTVVTIATGCGATLAEHPHWLGEQEGAPAVRDVVDFIASAAWPEPAVSPLAKSVAVHEPCSQRNILRTAQSTYRLLARIPALQAFPLEGNGHCCGAAGSYLLEHPQTAAQLREPKLAALEASGASYLVSANIGCALHLAAGARERGLRVEVMHPVTLLARQLNGSER